MACQANFFMRMERVSRLENSISRQGCPMISNEHKCIFVHIPKCAGTSVEAALGHLDGHDGRDGQDHRSIRMIEKPYLSPHILRSKENIKEAVKRARHNYLLNIANPKSKITVSSKQFRDYFKFTIVRNPWDRAFSWYKNVLVDDIHLKEHGVTKDVSLNQFLSSFAGKGMLKTQLYWIKSFDGSIPLDHIARFENLSEEMTGVFDKLGLKHLELPHRVQGTKASYRDHYDEDSIKIVADVYKEEIELFGYSFDGTTNR